MSDPQASALEKLSELKPEVDPIPATEYEQRIGRLQRLMRDRGISATYLHAGTNLYYFTGLSWNPSERMVAAIVPDEGEISYVAPRFELNTLKDFWLLEKEVNTWEEHESPFDLVARIVENPVRSGERVAVDGSAPFSFADRLAASIPQAEIISAQELVDLCRQSKSENEIAIIKDAHRLTLEVIRAAASILQPGMTTSEVSRFIDRAHRTVGANNGSYFCIVLFGVATSFPHGVSYEQELKTDDWVLIDTGFQLHGYHSDITRTFPHGKHTQRQESMWNLERQAQLAAFAAAQCGVACEEVDTAARRVLETAGLGPDYQVPGLPHRTGHGCGLEIHEAPYMVRGNKTPLQPGMVASIEPMLVFPEEFGIRLEDHFYMTESGPQWITQPATQIESP